MEKIQSRARGKALCILSKCVKHYRGSSVAINLAGVSVNASYIFDHLRKHGSFDALCKNGTHISKRWEDLERRNKPIKLDAIQVIESFCKSCGAIFIKIPVCHQHGLDLGRSLRENIMSIDAMNAEEMNVKDIETILMKIDRQRCVTVVDTSSDKKPAARIDINELPRKRTKSTESIEHFKFD